MTGPRLLGAVLCCVLCQGVAVAQGEPSYCNKFRFSIPFQVDPQDAGRVREAQLYESVDGRSNWRMVARIGPTDNRFQLQVPRDGEYWYLLRTMDSAGQAYPSQLDRLPADVQITKVIVDTAVPRIDFRELPGRGDQVAISWAVQDENLDINSLRLDYLNNGQWVPINITPQARGETSFTPRQRGRLELRLSVQDLARNQESRSLTVNAVGGGAGIDTGASLRDARDREYNDNLNSGRRSNTTDNTYGNTKDLAREPRYVNKETFNLNIDLEDVGPSGAWVEVFYQADNAWTPCGQKKVTGTGPEKVEVKLPREGNFGLIMMVRSGFDNVARKPSSSASPELWVCVDRTQPKVDSVQVTPQRGQGMGTVNISWLASDRNLAARSIRLEYQDVDDPDKSWRLIEEGQDNTGRYQWQTPRNGYRFKIRVSAVDKAKNVGEAVSQDVVVDVSQPKVRIVDIDH